MICEAHDKLRVELSETGRTWIRGAIDADAVDTLRMLSSTEDRPGARVSKDETLFRSITDLPVFAEISDIWTGMRPVRLVTFAKTEHRNWSVPWHQDRVIAVTQRADLPGYSNWSCKHGTWHCEPPIDLLSRMLFMRLHLDASTEDNGAMEIAPESHHRGFVSASRSDSVARACGSEFTIAQPGDLLILSMLTLHRSRPATSPGPRRVLRIDCSADELPAPLDWAI